jgi:hypothetical protein
MLEMRPREQALIELPRLPAVRDDGLVAALAQKLDAEQSPFGARLPTPGELVREAIYQPPPTLLHEQYQRSLGEALSTVAAAAGQLAAAAGALSPRNAFNAFRQIGVTVSNPAALQGVALSNARPASYSLVIERVAVSQESVGQLLPRDAAAGLEPGVHQVVIRSRQGRREVLVELKAGDDNEQVVASLAAAINAANLALSAALARPTPNLVQLAVSSSVSGLAGAFSFEPSRVVTYTGADRVARAASDAVFELNGVRTTSPDSLVSLQGGNVQLTLLRADAGERQMALVGADREAVLNAIEQLTEAASAFAVAVRDNTGALSRLLVSDHGTLVESLGDGLRQIGIDVQPDHTLALDEAMLAAMFARKPALVEEAIASPDGAAQRLGELAAGIMSAPVSRLGAPEFVPALPPPTSHPTPPMVLAAHTLSALLYAQLFAQGLFINSLF